MEVFRITAEICKQVFPVTLDVEAPSFLRNLDRMLAISTAMGETRRKPGLVSSIKRLGLGVAAGAVFARLYLLPGRKAELPQQVRLSPAW